MKNLLLPLFISLIIIPNLFAQDDECKEYQVTDEYSYNTRQYKDLNVSISYGLGDITIVPHEKKDILEGYLTYDERKSRPTVNMESISSSGFLKVKTKKFKDWEPCRESFKDLEKHFDSELEFYLPLQIDTDIFLDFGLGKANIDLTGLSITKLDLNCGLSDVNIDVNERNPADCDVVSIENGLGDFSFFGLGNLGAKNIDINIGLGSADIDLSGKKIKDMDVSVAVGLGSLDMILPKNTNIRIEVDASFLSSVDIYGLYQKKEHVWISPDWNKSYPTIEMDINIGMGSADIVVED